MKLDIENPLETPDWDQRILTHADHSFFHSQGWAATLHSSYAYRPLYLVHRTAVSISAMVPMMEVRSRITGRRGVSLPFTDYCEPLEDGGESLTESFRQLLDIASERRWRYVEFRGSQYGRLPDASPSVTHYGHTLDLTCGTEALCQLLASSVRRAIRKAGHSGLTASAATSLDAVRVFCRLNAMTRRDHGLPPQPFSFFSNLHSHVIGRGRGVVILASYEGKTVAGAVFGGFGHDAVFKYGASDKRFLRLRPNDLVMWEGIRWAVASGFRRLSMGRTERAHEGLRRYKQGWGTRETELRYYRYDTTHGRFATDLDAPVSALSRHVFRRMPLPLARMIGAALYPHMG